MPRADLKLTVGELVDWLDNECPRHALVKLNVGGHVADCEGHTVGHDANRADQPVLVLTGDADSFPLDSDIQVAGLPAILHASAYVDIEGVGRVPLPLEVKADWRGISLALDVAPAMTAIHNHDEESARQ